MTVGEYHGQRCPVWPCRQSLSAASRVGLAATLAGHLEAAHPGVDRLPRSVAALRRFPPAPVRAQLPPLGRGCRRCAGTGWTTFVAGVEYPWAFDPSAPVVAQRAILEGSVRPRTCPGCAANADPDSLSA